VRSTAASEQTLIRGLQSGDQQAFGKVYDAYHGAIYNLCARIVGDREEAKDLTQEVFLRAFSAPPEPRAQLGLRPWLYRVATNLCFNHLRSAGRRGSAAGDEIEQVASPVDRFQQARTVALVEETLGQLNDRYRTALVLKDLHGLPSDELAGVMETSRASADVLVHRARASFRSVFSRLAGEGAPVPGNLALVLAPLTVPVALQVMPPLAHVPAPAPHAPAPQASAPLPAHPAHPLDASGGGLLGKLSAALGSKVAVTAAAATLVAGGLAVEQVVTHTTRQADTAAAAAITVSGPTTSSQVGAAGVENQAHTRGLAGHGCPSGDSQCTADHLRADGHIAEHGGSATRGTHETTSSHGSTATHDSTGTNDSGAGTHSSGTSTTTSGDGADGTWDGHGGTGDH
jgi:RNA polymerase sigma-70 factor (ECF subfamily)